MFGPELEYRLSRRNRPLPQVPAHKFLSLSKNSVCGDFSSGTDLNLTTFLPLTSYRSSPSDQVPIHR